MAIQSDIERMEKELLKAQIIAMFRNTDAVEEALEKSRSDSERMANDILAGKKVTRALTRQKTAKRRKPHWKTSKKKARDHYLMHVAPKNAAKREALLREGDSWELIREYWHRKGIDTSVTESEWREHLSPVLDGQVFWISRYDTKLPMSLSNLIVRQTKTGKVLWDGAEFELRSLGYML